jgi:hypothetical protein
MADDTLLSYFRAQQASLQWSPVLRALAVEIGGYTDPDSLRELFFRIGQRFASDMAAEFSDARSLGELEDGLNGLWARMNWGWVSFREDRDGVHVQHSCAPLAEAFGDESLEWSVGLLEGIYTSLFRQLGAGDSANVRCVAAPDQGMHFELLLAV